MKAVALRVSTLVLALAVALPALASAQVDTVRKESTGQVMIPTYATVVAAITAAPEVTPKVAALTAPTADKIRLVDASEFVTEANKAQFDELVKTNEDAIEALQKELKKNDVITKALTDHPAKPDIGDVVAADVSTDGDVTIYFLKKG
jgi:dihydroxyacetone kinase